MPPAAQPETPPAGETLNGEQLREQLHQQWRGERASARLPPANLARPARPHEAPLARAIDDSARADCREAYAGAGLLAVVPLLVDTVRQHGCKW